MIRCHTLKKLNLMILNMSAQPLGSIAIKDMFICQMNYLVLNCHTKKPKRQIKKRPESSKVKEKLKLPFCLFQLIILN